jgi:hypothetical protein
MMMFSVTRNALFLALTASSNAFLGRSVARPASISILLSNGYGRTVTGASAKSGSACLFSSAKDTPTTLPDFASKADYLEYMETVSDLPKGFACGTAQGTFVSEEAPALGSLPIRGTVIHLTEGATDNWAAVFTTNKVGSSESTSERTFSSPFSSAQLSSYLSNVSYLCFVCTA